MQQLHPDCYSGCHIKLGQQHQHSSCVPFRITRPHRPIQSQCSSVQHPYYLLHIPRWTTSPTHHGGDRLEDLESSGSVISLPTLACLWLRDSHWHKNVCGGRKLLRPQRVCISNWLTHCSINRHKNQSNNLLLLPLTIMKQEMGQTTVHNYMNVMQKWRRSKFSRVPVSHSLNTRLQLH